MFIVLGATGHVGSAVAGAPRAAQEPEAAVVLDLAKAEGLRASGRKVAEIDVTEPDAPRAVPRRGRRASLLDPHGDTTGDGDHAERTTVRALLATPDGSGLEAVVARSPYGAQPGEANGDLDPLSELEEELRRQGGRANVPRAAHCYSNCGGLLAPARDIDRLPTKIPPDFAIPEAAPADLGEAAARMLREAPPPGGPAVHPVEGSRRLPPADLARAMEAALGREVVAEAVSRVGWMGAFQALGFSDGAAHSDARMTAITVAPPERLDGIRLPLIGDGRTGGSAAERRVGVSGVAGLGPGGRPGDDGAGTGARRGAHWGAARGRSRGRGFWRRRRWRLIRRPTAAR